MSNVAFVCPIYDSRNHFDYGLDLLKSKKENEINADFFFIFSNEEQKEKFSGLVNSRKLEEEFKYLILPETEGQYKSQVTIKKFYGLRCLKSQYKYIAAIDSESRFIKNIDYEKTFDTMWADGEMLKANIAANAYFIMRKCYKTLGIFDNKILKKETSNYLYNVWFNDIPLYKCDLLDEFFEWLDSLNQDYKKEWLCFEYYIFSAFLIIKKGYHLKKYNFESLGGIMEYLYVFPVYKQKEIIETLHTHWTSSDEAVNDISGIRFHLDRDENDETYNSSTFFKDIKKYKLWRRKRILKDFIGWDK